MDQSKYSISPHDLDPRLGANGLTMGIDVCCVGGAVDAERVVLPAFRLSPDGIAHGMDLPGAVVIELLPLGGIKGTQ
jgi:hypothetical protein